MSNPFLFPVLVVATLVSSVSFAQSQPHPNPVDSDSLETVVVTATRQTQPLFMVDGSVGVVDQQAIDSVQAVHVSELLVRIPGVWISRGNGQEHLTAIRSPVLTGAGACGAFLMQEDGISVRAPGFCNVNQMFEINTEQAARIEVLRGPASSVHGGNALHGVINVISQPVLPETLGQLGVEGGPDDYARVKFSYNEGDQETGWRIDANATHSDGYQDSSGYDQQKLDLAGKHILGAWQLRSHLSLTNLDQDTAGFIEGEESYKDHDLRQQNLNPDAYRNAWSARGFVEFQRLTDTGQQLSITPYLRYSDMEFLQHFVPWTPVEKTGVASFGVQNQLAGNWESGAVWMVGFDLDLTQGKLKETQHGESPVNPAAIPRGDHYDYEVDAITAAPFARLSVPLTGKLQLDAGLRYDYTRYDYNNRLTDGSACDSATVTCRFMRPADSSDSYGDWSPDLGLVYSLSDTYHLFSKVSQGFRAPQATELYRLQDGQAEANLDSESLDSVEAGLRGNWSRASLELAAFYMEKDNIIFQDSNRQNVDGASTSHQGLEATAFVQLADKFDLSASGTYAIHQYENDVEVNSDSINGNDVDTAPRYMAWVQLGWDYLPQGRAELELVHMGSYYLEANNLYKYSGHDIVNLRSHYQLGDNWRISAKLENVLDTDYAERADIGFGKYRYFVGLPRSLYLGIARQF